MLAKPLQLCSTLCNPIECSPAGSCIHEILQARILEWFAISFSRQIDITCMFNMALVIKNPPANAGDIREVGSIPESGRSAKEGKGNPLQYSCLENPMDRGVWWAAVHEVAQSRTRLKQVSSSSGCSYILILQFLFLYKMMSVMNRSFYFLLNNVTYIKASMFVPQLISVSHLISVFIYNICP